ncbi:hypothetical protein C3L33_18742, partial [Rhododendron williamsianum]
DTVSLTVAESEANFYHLSGSIFREAEKFRHLVPSLPASKTTVPVLALQVTLFPDAGLSIGYAAHHAVFDGKSISMFMHSWASICRHGDDSTLTTELTPFYDRTVINDPSDIEKAYLDGWLAHNGPNNRSLEIWDVKAPPDTIAYTWVCLIKTRRLATQKVQLVIGVDCRARLEPPIPSTYFGNCITGRIIVADTNKLMEDYGVAEAAREIGEAIRGLDDGVLNGAEEMISCVLSVLQEEGLFSLAASPRFEFYNTDFGWGRPTKVELVSIERSGAFSLSDSRDGNGGIEIGVVLKKHETEAFASLFASGCIVDADTNKCMEEDGVAIAAWAIGEVGWFGEYRRLTRFELYKTDFGWGRPSKVEMVSIDKSGAFYLSDSRDGNGGIEIGVVLRKHETEAFASMFASGLEYHQVREN